VVFQCLESDISDARNGEWVGLSRKRSVGAQDTWCNSFLGSLDVLNTLLRNVQTSTTTVAPLTTQTMVGAES